MPESVPRIIVPPIDPEAVARELERLTPLVQEEIRRLEEAKRVSAETMRKVITI